MSLLKRASALVPLALAAYMVPAPLFVPIAQAQTTKPPNIVVIMGDDIGWSNIGAYNQGLMATKTPSLDKLACGRHPIYRLLRRGQLHGGSSGVCHRSATNPHWVDHGGAGGRHCRYAGSRANDSHGPQVNGLCHRSVR